MPQYNIPHITGTEPRVVRTTLKGRCGRDVEARLADAAVRIRPAGRGPASRPVTVRQSDDGCCFIVRTAGERTCRCRFFDEPREQTGTGTRGSTTWPGAWWRCGGSRPVSGPRRTATCPGR